MIAGIDPGLSGGIAIIGEQGTVLLVDDLPVHQVIRGKAKKAELDVASLRALLLSHPLNHIVIERVSARPRQGVASMFRFGYVSGAIYGLVIGLQLPVSFILPVQWQKVARCGPSPDEGRRRGAELYPAAAEKLSRKKDSGRADALLIAHVGAQMLLPSRQAA